MTRLEIDKVIEKLAASQQALIHEIHVTCTGPARVAMCAANLQVTLALQGLCRIRSDYAREQP